MSAGANPRPNPYVGPRAFERGEELYGRNRELTELARLLVAEHIVLCHSPSGAGKTSLIQASLIPELEERRQFHVYPLIRVNLELPQELPPTLAPNRYVLSMLRCLEADRPTHEQLSLDILATQSLTEYFAQRNGDKADQDDQVLIFDQFEEIIAVEPLDLPAKAAFFEQLGELLRGNDALWALFAMREEYVASLDPFRQHIPRRLRTTYRLPLLERKMAIEAMTSPALRQGVTFTPAAAARLADDLSRMRVRRPDGASEYQAGPYVEPVQLQVVCLRLWEQLGATATEINESDIAEQGDVNSALSEFYNEQVRAIAERTAKSEHEIRIWFDQRLITPDGVRTQVLQGQHESAGLDNRVVFELVRVHLVRLEQQRGAAWLELAHDRLIEPIRNANSAWHEEHQSPLQKQAALWEAQGRPEGLLLTGQTLSDAERWAAANSAMLGDTERAFLANCRRERNRRRGAVVLGAVLAVTAATAILAGLFANSLREEAVAQQSLALYARSTAESEASNASRAQSVAQTSQARAESEAATAQAALALVQTAQSQTESSVNQQAAVRLSADQLAALDGGDPDQALTLALGGLRAPVESPQLDLLLSRAADVSGTRAVLPGDTNEVLSVAVSPDGRLAYTGDRAGVVRIWNLSDGTPAGQFSAHRGGVQKISFSPDRSLIGTASDDRTVRIWNAATGDQLHTIGPHNGPVVDFVFSADNRSVLTSSENGPVRLWDIASQSEIRSFPGKPAVAFSPDGGSVVAVEDRGSLQDGTLLLIDLATGAEQMRFEGHQRAIQDVLFSRDGRTLITASTDGTIRFWDVTSGLQTGLLSGHTATVWSIALNADESRLLSSSADNTIRLWNVRTREELRQYTGHIGSVYDVVFTMDGDRFVSGAEDGQGRVWDVAGRQELAVLEGVGGSLQDVDISPDGQEIIAASTDGAIYRWGRANGASLPPLVVGNMPIFGAAYSPAGDSIAVGLENGTVSVIPASGGPPLWSATRRGEIPSVAYSPDGRYVLAGSASGAVNLWLAADGSLVTTFPGLRSDATSVAFRLDGQAVAASSQDWSVRLWDVDTQAEIRAYTGHLAGVLSVAISPDGHMIASGGTDRQVILWDAATGELKHRLIGHAAGVWGVTFSPDGALVASGSADRTVRIWDVATGREIRRYTGHTQRVWSVAFTPDGRSIVSASADRTVRIWRLESRQELIEWVLANRYVPPLTCDQKKLYRLAGECVDTNVPETTPDP